MKRLAFSLLYSLFLIPCASMAQEKQDGLLFYHNFEKTDFSASVSAGDGKAQKNGDVRMVPGIDGKAALVGQHSGKNFFLSFSSKNNLPLNEGTVSFWAQPYDWDGTTRGAILLFGAADERNDGFRVYKFSSPGYLWFLSGKLDKSTRKTQVREIIKNIKNWKKGEWHHIAVSYRRGGKTFIGKEQRIRIYVDGKLSQEKILEDEKYPDQLPVRFHIGPERIWSQDLDVSTAIDELKIYGNERSPAEIHAEYLQHARIEAEKTKICVSECAKSPVANNKIIPGVWPSQGGTNLFYDRNGRYSELSGRVRVATAFDKDYFYVEIREKLKKESLKSKVQERDGAVYRDDSYEFFLGSASNPRNYRHYIVNSLGTIYDAAGKSDANWNGNALVSSKVSDGTWILRLALPFSDLPSGKNTKDLIFNISRNDFNASGEWSAMSLADVRGNFHQPERFADLNFLPAGQTVDIALNNPLESGEVALNIQAPSGSTAAIQIWENGRPIGKETSRFANSPVRFTRYFSRGAEARQYRLDVAVSNSEGIVIAKQNTSFNLIPHVLISSEYDIESNAIHFRLTPAGEKEKRQLTANTSVEFLFSKDTKILKSLKRPYTPVAALPVSDLPRKDCKLECRFLASDGKILFRGNADYLFFDYDAWKDFNGGLDDNIVPAPWIPVIREQNGDLKCLNRNYVFGQNALPQEIREKGINLLSRKIRLVATRKKQTFDISDFPLSQTDRKRGKIRLSGSAAIGGSNISASVEFEFDGYCVWSFDIAGQNDFDDLRLEIPLTKSLSQLQYIPFLNEKHPVKSDIGTLTSNGTWPFGPGLWIGNDERGITFFTESDQYHFLKAENKFYSVKKNKQGEAILTVHMIDHPGDFPEKLHYRFGIQATPVKPFSEPEDFLAYGLVNGVNNKLYITGFHNHINDNIQGFPGNHGRRNAAAATEKYAAHVVGLQSGNNQYKAKLLAIQYMNPNMCPITVPEFSSFKKYWTVVPNDVWSTDGPDPVPSIRVSPNSQLWSNFYAYRFSQYFRKSGVNGIYSDFAHPIKDMNPLTNSGYERDGKRRPTYSIYKYHELQKRLYIMAKECETPERRIFFIGHSGGTYCLPHANFWDMVVDPEYLGGVISSNSPTLDYITPDRIRAEYNGRQFGVILNFIPIREGKFRKYTDDVMTMITAAAIPWWNHTFLLWDRQSEVYQAYSKIGFTGNTVFLPFWNNAEYIQSSSPDVRCTIVGKKGKMVLSVCNFSEQAQNASVTLNPEKLLFGNKMRILQATTGKEVKQKENTITVELSGRNFIQFLLLPQ